MKVEITKCVGQTGLRRIGVVLEHKDGAIWVKNGWAKEIKKPKPKKKRKKNESKSKSNK
jgi:hypothetical protein